MESIFLILLLVVLGLIVSPIILLFSVSNLRRRVDALEECIHEGRLPARPLREESVQERQQPVLYPQHSAPTALDRFVLWAKEDWLLKLGALLLIIAFGWLTTYAFMNNWIGPMGRIAFGIVAGVLFLLLGFWRIQKFIHQGGVFLVLGSTVILVTIFAARSVYGFFTPLSALALMFLSTAFVGFASVRYNNRALALGSLILASVAPLLTHSPEPNLVGLFTYLLIVTLGAIWIAVIIRRHELTAAALIIIALYSIPTLASKPVELPTLLLLAYAFAAAFFVTNTAGLLKLEKKEMLPDLLTAAGTGLFLLAWIMMAAPDEWKSLIIVGWMLLFVIGAFSIFTITHKREPLYVYVGVGIVLLAGATAAKFEGAALTIAYTLETGVIAALAYGLLKDLKIALRTSLLFVGPIALSVDSLTSPQWSMGWSIGIWHDDFFVLLTLGVVLLGLGAFLWSQARMAKPADLELPSGLLAALGSLYLYALLWLSLQATLQDATAVMSALAVYTIIGLITHLAGKAKGQQGLKVYGGVVLGCVVARLLLIDVWSMELSGRIVTFFLVGALLISTAFIGRKKRTS
ncbi:MAG: DUF2339 domain-containing protein [Candidatus Peribacteraceae bacterium]|nr:DUF2339 domain-containing protein [Candidatus Peribacteraceae bacterium]MDD5742522.1 DUF2339 domain-containing protein [Candidatus Peribacteraceae bacterium]